MKLTVSEKTFDIIMASNLAGYSSVMFYGLVFSKNPVMFAGLGWWFTFLLFAIFVLDMREESTS